ncbi:phospholipase A and acyltransferase 3-like isoform X2 [Artemia franciscana]|uniref:phospholipase A and acyltransferase 3-like isoform X2 n=1 Tax=Artemia franciscana TaxID=6661 RepID=UPI0032DA167E
MGSLESPSLEAADDPRVSATEIPVGEEYPSKAFVSEWFRKVEILKDMFTKMLHIGDLLEFERGHYRHWAVYIGNGSKYENEVVHLCNLGSTGRWFSGGSKFTEGQNNSGNPVQAGDLFDVWADSACRINNSYDEKSHPFPWHEIYNRAILFSFASEKEFERYNVLKMNCEHFAHFVRNHHAESQQVKDFLLRVYQNGLSVAKDVLIPTLVAWKFGPSAAVGTFATSMLGYAIKAIKPRAIGN